MPCVQISISTIAIYTQQLILLSIHRTAPHTSYPLPTPVAYPCSPPCSLCAQVGGRASCPVAVFRSSSGAHSTQSVASWAHGASTVLSRSHPGIQSTPSGSPAACQATAQDHHCCCPKAHWQRVEHVCWGCGGVLGCCVCWGCCAHRGDVVWWVGNCHAVSLKNI